MTKQPLPASSSANQAFIVTKQPTSATEIRATSSSSIFRHHHHHHFENLFLTSSPSKNHRLHRLRIKRTSSTNSHLHHNHQQTEHSAAAAFENQATASSDNIMLAVFRLNSRHGLSHAGALGTYGRWLPSENDV